MTYLTAAEARPLVGGTLSDDELTAAIEREEAELEARIGSLGGPLSLLVEPTVPPLRPYGIVLPRPTTDTPQVEAYGSFVDPELVELYGPIGEQRVALSMGTVTPLTITYYPSDGPRVKRVLIELLRLTLAGTGYASETIGSYSYAVEGTAAEREATRERLYAQLLRRPRRPGTVRILGASRGELSGIPVANR